MRILRAAERIFAEEGYHGATMREVARAAGVGVSLVTYHYESKGALYYAIFENRQYVNEERIRLLDAIEDLSAPDALERVVSAFVDPVLALHGSSEDVWYARLMLREAADPSSQDRAVISTLFDPLARRFIKALSMVLPDKDDDFVLWAYLFSVGVLTQSAFDGRIANLTQRSVGPSKNDMLHSYIVAGLRHG